MLKESEIELLKHIAEVEDDLDPQSFKGTAGWRSTDVGIWPGTLTKLRITGYIEDVYESNSYHGYRLSQKARTLLAGEPEHVEAPSGRFPDDLFDDIIGHAKVKELLRACLLAEKPVHVLLAGPPALAKTLFLWDIEKALGERAVWLVGSAVSKAGLWDLVAEKRPYALMVDEMDKMNAADTAALLSMMEGGRLVRAKVGRELTLTHEIRVVAATNRAYLLSPELRSRFAIRELHPYSRDEYLIVVKGVLVRRENASPELAEEIAKRLDGRSQDVRDAVRVVRLAPQLGVENAVRLLLNEE